MDEPPPYLSSVHSTYHDLAMAFSKARASSLPPHCPYGYAMDLLPGITHPRGHLYQLTGHERDAMTQYL